MNYNGHYVSSISSLLPDKWICKYELGVVTKPILEKSMLFAFLELEDARKFASNNNLVHIFKCETPYVIKNILPQNISSDAIIAFWNEQAEKRNFDPSKLKEAKRGLSNIGNFIYQSSVCCPSLKPIEKVA